MAPSPCVAISQLGFTAENLSGREWQIEAVKIELGGANFSRLALSAEKVRVGTHEWRSPKLICTTLLAQNGVVRCTDGVLQLPNPIPFTFAANGRQKKLELTLVPKPQEIWQGILSWPNERWQGEVTVKNGEITRFSPWLSASLPTLSGGQISGSMVSGGSGKQVLNADINLKFSNLKFNDAKGMHAGENLAGSFLAKAQRAGAVWKWQGDGSWTGGEVFWQPWYAKAAHRFEVRGVSDEKQIRIDQGVLNWTGVGKAAFSGVWQRPQAQWQNLAIAAADLDVGALYSGLIAPSLRQPTLANLKTRGRADINLAYGGGRVESGEIIIREGAVEDPQQRVALTGVDLRLPWARQTEKQGEVRISRARVAKIELGPIQTTVQTRGDTYKIKNLLVPVLDGKLQLNNLEVEKTEKGWQAEGSGELIAVSMQKLAGALELPVMHGELSGKIPHITYRDNNLRADGNLLVRVFDGLITIKNFSVREPFGNLSLAAFDIDMRNLDLALVTRAFSFGTMEGRIDVKVEDLELANWAPTKFDASIESSPGRYPKKISQKAVQNISALGGAGPAAAIQRSFLSFFEQFGYNRLALSCQLRNGICTLAGIEPKGAGFVIVEGGGIPAITVLGYNREVSWQELVDRLGRITEGGANSLKQIEKE